MVKVCQTLLQFCFPSVFVISAIQHPCKNFVYRFNLDAFSCKIVPIFIMRLFNTVSRSPCLRCLFSSVASPASALKKPNRFYKSVEVREVNNDLSARGVLHQNGVRKAYGIFLDGRSLRTPLGNHFCTSAEPLALVVAQEWDAQVDVLRMETMHFTGLSFSSVDNPCNETNESLVKKLLAFLQTDTLLYFAEPLNTFSDVQRKYWSPVIQFANHRFGLCLQPVDGVSAIAQPELPQDTLKSMEQHLMGLPNTFPSLIGIWYGTEAVKSLLLVLATLESYLEVDTAVTLSRLEQIHQTKTWGTVEWAHDVEHHEHCARLAASVLFARCFASPQSLTATTTDA